MTPAPAIVAALRATVIHEWICIVGGVTRRDGSGISRVWWCVWVWSGVGGCGSVGVENEKNSIVIQIEGHGGDDRDVSGGKLQGQISFPSKLEVIFKLQAPTM
jgi:hypothetical protein